MFSLLLIELHQPVLVTRLGVLMATMAAQLQASIKKSRIPWKSLPRELPGARPPAATAGLPPAVRADAVSRAGDAFNAWLFGLDASRGGVDLVLTAISIPQWPAAPAPLRRGLVHPHGRLPVHSADDGAGGMRGQPSPATASAWNTPRLMSMGLGGLLTEAIGILAVYVAGGCSCWLPPP